MNEAPVALGFSDVHGSEDHPIAAIDLKSGWLDPESDGLSYQILSASNTGLFSSATITPDGMLVLTAAPDANGTCVIDLLATDAYGLTAVSQLTVVLAPVNDRPVASPDVLNTKLGTAVVFTPADLLANDRDVDSTSLSVVIKKQPQHGLVFSSGNGTFTYLPIGGFTGIDSFEYAVSDGSLLSTNTVVSVNVAALAPSPGAAQSQSNEPKAAATNFTSGGGSSTPGSMGTTSNLSNASSAQASATSVPAPNSTTTGGISFRERVCSRQYA